MALHRLKVKPVSTMVTPGDDGEKFDCGTFGKTRVSQLAMVLNGVSPRDTKIPVLLAIGYGDGLPSHGAGGMCQC